MKVFGWPDTDDRLLDDGALVELVMAGKGRALAGASAG